MLVLSRKVDERILIGENIVITITRIERDKVRIGIEAPPDVIVMRQELLLEKRPELLEKRPRPKTQATF